MIREIENNYYDPEVQIKFLNESIQERVNYIYSTYDNPPIIKCNVNKDFFREVYNQFKYSKRKFSGDNYHKLNCETCFNTLYELSKLIIYNEKTKKIELAFLTNVSSYWNEITDVMSELYNDLVLRNFTPFVMLNCYKEQLFGSKQHIYFTIPSHFGIALNKLTTKKTKIIRTYNNNFNKFSKFFVQPEVIDAFLINRLSITKYKKQIDILNELKNILTTNKKNDNIFNIRLYSFYLKNYHELNFILNKLNINYKNL